MANKTKVVLNMDRYDNNSINAEWFSQEERDKLLDEITMLRTHISLLEIKLETPKFSQLKLVKKPSKMCNKEAIFRNIPDIQTELCYDFYRFAGMQCVKFANRFVFEISSTENVVKNDLYTIEILIDKDGHGKLGKSVLPMSIDVLEILSQHPVHDLNNMKHFLRNCKHHIDCYVYRMEQFEKLQNLLLGIKNICVHHSIGITHIELKMSQLKDIDSNKFYNVTLYLHYNSAEVIPCVLFSDTDDNEKLSSDLLTKLRKYFKPFRMMDLSSAFLKIIESRNKFIWTKILHENEIKIYDESDDEHKSFLAKFLYQNNKLKNSKNEAQDKNTILHENEIENSLDVEEEKNQDINVTEEDTASDDFSVEDNEIKSRKHKQSNTILKLRDTKKSKQTDLKKSGTKKKEKSEIGKENNQNVTDVNNSLSNLASVIKKNPTLRPKKSNKGNVNIECTQMEGNHNNNKKKKILLRKTTNKNKNKQSQKLLKSNMNLTNSEKARKKRKMITCINEIEEKEGPVSSNSNNEERAVLTSTPVLKILPDKRKFFPEMSSIMK